MSHRGQRTLALLAPAAALAALEAADPFTTVLRALGAGLRADDGGVTLVGSSAGLAAWAILGWLLVAGAAAVLAAAPGTAGRAGARIAEVITPAVIRRLVGGGAAVGLAIGPALVPMSAGAAPVSATTRAVGVTTLPGDGPAVQVSAGPACLPTSWPSLDRPGCPVTAPSSHLVRPGDTLWGIAQAELAAAGAPSGDQAVAARWPVWWRTNRAEIGADPDHLVVGETLAPPDSASATQTAPASAVTNQP